jgi:hypothetical protein
MRLDKLYGVQTASITGVDATSPVTLVAAVPGAKIHVLDYVVNAASAVTVKFRSVSTYTPEHVIVSAGTVPAVPNCLGTYTFFGTNNSLNAYRRALPAPYRIFNNTGNGYWYINADDTYSVAGNDWERATTINGAYDPDMGTSGTPVVSAVVPATGTELTGTTGLSLPAKGVIAAGYNPYGWFSTVSGEYLQLLLRGTSAVSGHIVYAVEPQSSIG